MAYRKPPLFTRRVFNPRDLRAVGGRGELGRGGDTEPFRATEVPAVAGLTTVQSPITLNR